MCLAEELRIWSLEHGGPPRKSLDDTDFEDSLSAQETGLHGRMVAAYDGVQRAGSLGQRGEVLDEAIEEDQRQHAGVDMEEGVGVADDDMHMDTDKQWQQIVAEYQ